MSRGEAHRPFVFLVAAGQYLTVCGIMRVYENPRAAAHCGRYKTALHYGMIGEINIVLPLSLSPPLFYFSRWRRI